MRGEILFRPEPPRLTKETFLNGRMLLQWVGAVLRKTWFG